MWEFLRFVLSELHRYSVLVLLVCIAVFAVCCVIHSLYKRKCGADRKFPWKKVLLLLIFTTYLLLVIFATNMRASGVYRQVNLHLFRGWREAWNDFSVKNWANVLLNIAMFGPMGFLLPLLGRIFRRWYVTIPLGFCVSAAIELVQLAFIRGVCDVDDLFCNTLGCAIGYFVVMTVLSAFGEKGRRFKPVLSYGFLVLIFVSAVGSIFVGYQVKEFGNLPDAASYTIDTKNVDWYLECSFPEMGETAAVYRTQTRSREDCDTFAEEFRRIIPTDFDDISYYQEAAYYMNHGSDNGAHFLYVHYLDQGYEYSAIYEDDPVWTNEDQDTILNSLEKYPILIPEGAEFTVEGEGWHSFEAEKIVDGAILYDGKLRVRVTEDGSVWDMENSLLSYSYYSDNEVLSPEEAYGRLCAGKFQDSDFFEMKNPSKLSVVSCALEYRVDTKGFYQPVYVFELRSPDGDYQSRAVIPALK